MKDNITLERIKTLHPKLVDEANKIYEDICNSLKGNAMCRFAYTLRTFDEQNKLFLKRPKVTNARGGKSFHNYGLAVDIVLIINGKEASWNMVKDFDNDNVSDWMEVVKIFKSYGWEWGGDWKSFKDYPHFQKTFGYTINQLLDKYNKKQFIGNSNYAVMT
jgi:peptidoglycan L-alanyl-D-glutamate endopeptidase CwlK